MTPLRNEMRRRLVKVTGIDFLISNCCFLLSLCHLLYLSITSGKNVVLPNSGNEKVTPVLAKPKPKAVRDDIEKGDQEEQYYEFMKKNPKAGKAFTEGVGTGYKQLKFLFLKKIDICISSIAPTRRQTSFTMKKEMRKK